MMPAKPSTSHNSRTSEVYLLDMKEIVTYDAKVEEENNLLGIINEISKPVEFKETQLKYETCIIDIRETSYNVLSSCDTPVKQYGNSSDDSSDICTSIIKLKIAHEVSSEEHKSVSTNQSSRYVKKSTPELNSSSLKQLQVLFEDLSHVVEEVSGELVQLLLENDALQQESDARNVAIEQLLKMTVKNTENELRPIQMSIVLPSDEESDDC